MATISRGGFARITLAFFTLWIAVACAVPAAAQSKSPPQLTASVNDFAGIIDAESERELDKRIRALQQASGDVIVVATVPTIEPFGTIDEYAVEMFENGGRGVGQKGKDNGALIVVSVKERQVRIEVGYDLEEFIPDGFAGQTIREAITPEFRSGNYGRGLVAGTTRLIQRVAERRGVELANVPPERPQIRAPRAALRGLPILLLWLFLIIAMSSRRRRRRRGWGGGAWSGWNSGVGPFGGGFGGFGGGFGGFGGGGGSRGGFGGGGFGGFGGGRSGGGGASGGW